MTTVKPLALEPDVYSYILDKLAESGQSASSFLRNRLGISPAVAEVQAPPTSASTSSSTSFDELLNSSRFRYAKGVVGRFLVVLAWLYSRHRKEFVAVESVKGRGRLYFARSAQQLKESGKSVNPKPIPDSPYWVITTSPTNLKQEMLGSAMNALGYSKSEIARAQSAIARDSERQRMLDTL
jgi:negative modulator of initiation of replication